MKKRELNMSQGLLCMQLSYLSTNLAGVSSSSSVNSCARRSPMFPGVSGGVGAVLANNQTKSNGGIKNE